MVEFCDGSFRIYDKDFTSYDRWMYGKVEVIGNVYDDVNLLEAKKARIHDNPGLMGGEAHG